APHARRDARRPQAEKSEGPEGHQRHRPEGDGARHRVALSARRRAPRRRAGGARPVAAPDTLARRRRRLRRRGRRGGNPDAAEGPRGAASPFLLALPQTVARAFGPLSLLRRSSVSVASRIHPPDSRLQNLRLPDSSMLESRYGISGHGQDLDERQAGGLEG